jgi:predicted flavoprotein YhiN
VTNTVVTERDYWGGRRTMIRRVLSRLPVDRTVDFFAEIGVPLKTEPTGKMFPQSDRSRDVLDALLAAARAVDAHHRLYAAQRRRTASGHHRRHASCGRG